MNKIPNLSGVEKEILSLLTIHGQLYGLEMVKLSESIKRGTVYVLLNRMSEKGFVKSRVSKERSGGPPRRKYTVTALGNQVLRAQEVADSEFFRGHRWRPA